MIIHILTAWFLGLAVVTTVLFLWFKTSLMGELFILLKELGFKAKVPGYWTLDGSPGIGVELFTRSNWDTWLMLKVEHQQLSRRLYGLLSCPGCMSVHVAWITAVAILASAGLDLPVAFVWLGTLGWPAPANALLNRIHPPKA